MSDKRLKFFGWGYEGDQVAQDELQWFERTWSRVLGTDGFLATPAPQLADIELRRPRVSPPASLAAICSTEKYDRAAHTYGKSVIDLARMLAHDFSNPPDVVAYPHTEEEVVALLDWAGGSGIAVILSLPQTSSAAIGFRNQPLICSDLRALSSATFALHVPIS